VSATYVYGLVAGKKPSTAKLPPGLPGSEKPRLLDAGGGLHAIVATAPLELYGEEAIERGLQDLEWVSECAIAHERVVEHFAAARALVPLKLFTIFHSDARALEHVKKNRARIDAVVERVADRIELGVRVGLDPRKAARTALVTKPESGSAFLLGKKKQKDDARALAGEAREEADALHERLEALALDAVKKPPIAEGPRLLLDAAYLVARKKRAEFARAVAREAKALGASGLDVTLTGPWPPYHFAGIS
jgi:hypothetical protein